MKKIIKIAFILVFGISNFVFAQEVQTKKIVLNWIEGVDFEIGNGQFIRTSIIEGNFLNEELQPYFSETWEVNNGFQLVDFQITDIKYAPIPVENGVLKSKQGISDSLVLDFHISKARDRSIAVLNVLPFVKEGNRIKKLVSFNLEYRLASTGRKSTKNSSLKNSVLASGEWFKFAVDTTGVFKLDNSFLKALGIDVNAIDPKNIQIYGNGGAMLPFINSEFRYDGLQENAIFVSGEGDGSFDSNDFILFYAQGPEHWQNPNNTLNSMRHQQNIFSDEAYYFITVGDSSGIRITDRAPVEGAVNSEVNTFQDFTFFEKDEVNLFAIGQQWFGDNYSIENVHSYSIPFPNIVANEPVTIRVRGVSESSVTSSMDVKVANQDLFSVTIGAISGLNRASANENSGEIQLTGDAVNLQITYNNNGNPSARAYLDYIEVLGSKTLLADGNQFRFRNFNVINTAGVYNFSVANGESLNAVWDISNPLKPQLVENEGGSDYSFKVEGGNSHEFIALAESDFYKPIQLEDSRVENQNLHSKSELDYIIVTRAYLESQAQRLADYHIENSNLNVEVVLLDQIYNEFSSGSPDLTAIRDFARHLYLNSTSKKLQYICLFGDASYDYKDRLGGNNNIVPVFEAYNSFNLAASYVTDDYYGMMDENEGGMSSFDRQDIVTGRIPVTDVLQASEVLTKILNYYSPESFGGWRNELTLIADDIDSRGEEVIQEGMERLADTISVNTPLFNLKKIYLDAYVQENSSGGERYPTVNVDIVNQVEKGTLLIDYFGHGGEDGWAAERVLGVPEIQDFSNNVKLPLFVTVTCDFTRFDNPLRKTAGEFLLWNSRGGAASLISTTREIYISVGQAFNERFIKPLLNFNNQNYSIAESLVSVKNQFSTSQRFFIYSFGDPAMKLHIPKPRVEITKMNGVPITVSLDTIKALSYVKFEGDVVNEQGALLQDFNGELDVAVFDKPILKRTLDNDNFNIYMDFDVLESKIFNGRSKVSNGKFEFEFIAPKDLKVAYGKGKLSLYAFSNVLDKGGYTTDVVVGGINYDAPEDNIGPTVQLYMNDLSFVDGGNTNESPVFIAVLEDESGINTSITAVDHDIVAILDGDQSNPIILNDYYETDLDDFKKGRVTYPFRDLTPGLHTISLKVWDSYNNVSESTFSFFVVDDSELVLTNVLNYPNPFINHTEFWFNHNKPNELLEVQVQIFTVSGKLVKTISETVQSEGGLSRSINWNGLDDFGAKVGKGVYVYKLKVHPVNSSLRAEKIEKLVILQ